MELHLYKAVLVNTFGRNSQQAFRATLWRLGGCMAASTLLGILIAYGMASLPVPAVGSKLTAAIALVTAIQVCLLFVLVAASGVLHGNSVFEKMLLFLPLKNSVKWRAYCLPGFVLAVFAFALTAPSLFMLTSRMGIGPIFLTLCCSLGFIAALAGFYSTLPLRGARLAAISLILAVEYGLTRLSATAPLAATLGYIGLLVAVCVVSYAVTSQHLNRVLYARQSVRSIGTALIPASLWLLKKAMRNHSFRSTLATNLLLSAGLSIGLSKMPGGVLIAPVFASLLVATFVSDIRSLARTTAPAEITALRGTGSFFLAELCTAAFLASALAIPLFVVLHPSIIDLTHIAASIGVGLFAGSLIAPAHKDITAQFFATLLCVSILIISGRFSSIAALSSREEQFLFTAFTTVMCLASYAIEYKRNPYAWRHHVTKTFRTIN